MMFVYLLELWVEFGVLSRASMRNVLGFGGTGAVFVFLAP